MLRKFCGGLLFALLVAISPAHAQSFSLTILPSGCGTANYQSSLSYLTVDSTGKLCTAASVSASISGFPTVQTTGTPISVTTGGVTGTLPSGAVVVATNVGTTNAAYCKLGASATTSDQYIAPSGGWFAFTVGANTQLTCITSTSTTTVNMVGGSGLPTGTGGGGGSSGGTSNITQTAGTNIDPTIAATGQLPIDTKTNSNLYTLLNSATPAGTNTIGNVGFDPSQGKGTPTSAPINVSTATTTQLIALSGSTKIYVTSFDVIAGGTGNITFEYGTGASCGTGTTVLTGAYPLTAQAGIAKGNGAAPVLIVPAGNALCVLTSAAVQMSGSISYQQF